MSPNRRRRSSICTASSRSSASSDTSKSASRVTLKTVGSLTSICGKSEPRKCAITSSSGTKTPRAPTSMNRGSPSGTFTRASRSSPCPVADEHRQAQRQRRDVRKRLAGADGERRQHGIDLLLEPRCELDQLLLGELLHPGDDDPLARERRAQVAAPEPRLPLVQRLHALADLRERRARRPAVLGPDVQPGGSLVEQARDSHPEELVQVRREERAVLDPLQERLALVERLLEHARAPVDPRELAIEESISRSRLASCRGLLRPPFDDCHLLCPSLELVADPVPCVDEGVWERAGRSCHEASGRRRRPCGHDTAAGDPRSAASAPRG